MGSRQSKSGSRAGSLARAPPARTHVAFLGGPELAYAESCPPPELAPWVAVSWRVRARSDAELRIVPDGCMDLLRGDVIGTFTGPEVVRFATGDVAEGIRFHDPKRLMRIARMQGVLRGGRGESWARTAAEHGYFDEAHMASDVGDLAGATPHALLG